MVDILAHSEYVSQAMRRHPKYQVFVSSTYADLHNEREAITWKLLKDFHIPAGMETFPASDERGWETIARSILDSDYYVLILGWRYGSIEETTKLSWTHREYRFAIENEIPVLAFLRDKRSTTFDKVEETPDGLRGISEFRQEVERDRLYKTWREGADLCNAVGESLWHLIRRNEQDGNPRPGWFRGDGVLGSLDAVTEMARLSRENNELKARLAELSASGQVQRPRLALGNLPTEVPLRLHAYKQQGDNVSIMTTPATTYGCPPDQFRDWVDARHFSVWLSLTVENTSSALAEDLVVDITIPRTKKVILQPADAINITSNARPDITARAFDTSRSVYIQKIACVDGGCTVRQRIRSVHGNSNEDMVPFGVIMNSDLGWPEKDEITLIYAIRERSGTRVDERMAISVVVEVGPGISPSSAQSIYESAKHQQ